MSGSFCRWTVPRRYLLVPNVVTSTLQLPSSFCSHIRTSVRLMSGFSEAASVKQQNALLSRSGFVIMKSLVPDDS